MGRASWIVIAWLMMFAPVALAHPGHDHDHEHDHAGDAAAVAAEMAEAAKRFVASLNEDQKKAAVEKLREAFDAYQRQRAAGAPEVR